MLLNTVRLQCNNTIIFTISFCLISPFTAICFPYFLFCRLLVPLHLFLVIFYFSDFYLLLSSLSFCLLLFSSLSLYFSNIFCSSLMLSIYLFYFFFLQTYTITSSLFPSLIIQLSHMQADFNYIFNHSTIAFFHVFLSSFV